MKFSETAPYRFFFFFAIVKKPLEVGGVVQCSTPPDRAGVYQLSHQVSPDINRYLTFSLHSLSTRLLTNHNVPTGIESTLRTVGERRLVSIGPRQQRQTT